MVFNKENAAHTTEREKNFLYRIGTFRPKKANEDKEQNRRMLLNGYLNSMDKRKDWGDMDKQEVKSYCQFLINNIN